MRRAHGPDCRHPKFELERGDRAAMSFAAAVAIGNRRALSTGVRQTVRRHIGPVFRRGVYFVQAVREVSP
jgi:hypothetical protein